MARLQSMKHVVCSSGRVACCALATFMALAVDVRSAGAASTSDSSATSNSSDWFSTSSGWKKDRVFYPGNAKELPVGTWEDQFKNSFGGTPTVGGGGWTTWSSLNKPNDAGWKADNSYKSNPYPHVDTSAAGSTAKNWTYLNPYKAFGGYYAKKQTYSEANAKKSVAADNPTVAETRITDPWTMPSPDTGNWSVALDYSQFGSFDSANPASSLFANYSLVLNPTSLSSDPVTYNLLSITLTAGGAVSVTSDLNNNDAEVTNNLVANQLNGVLIFDGVNVTAAQAAADLLTYYSSTAGWNLNPNGYTLEDFRAEDPTKASSVFTLSARVFLDPSTASVTVGTINGSSAVATPDAADPVPEPMTLTLLGTGFVGVAIRVRRRSRRIAAARQ